MMEIKMMIPTRNFRNYSNKPLDKETVRAIQYMIDRLNGVMNSRGVNPISIMITWTEGLDENGVS